MIDPAAMQASKRQSIGQRVLLSIGFTMLLCISLASIWLVNRAREETDALQNSVRIENSIMQMGAYLRRAESAQRGFLISENESYLDLFESGLKVSADGAAAVGPDDFAPEEDKQAINRIKELSTQKIRELRETVELQRYGARDEAIAVVKSDVGERVMREIATLIEQLRDRSRARVAARASEARTANLTLLFVTLSSTLTIFVIAFLSQRASRTAIAAIEEARIALVDANSMLERRVAERTSDLQEANNEIQGFAYIVSHDLRSPLVNIMGFTSELESLRDDVFSRLDALAGPEDDARKTLASDFTEAFGFIKASTGKMDRLINAILKLARQGRRKLVPSTVDLGALTNTIAKTMQHQLVELGASIEVKPLPSIESDQLALEQILTNLLDNAVKYLRPEEPGRIEVRAVETPGLVTLEIEDNGRGIDEKDKARVFELFRRSGKQDRPGEGIGLAHVRSMVRRLGGTITLDSEFGRGTVVKVTLPRQLAAEDVAVVREGTWPST